MTLKCGNMHLKSVRLLRIKTTIHTIQPEKVLKMCAQIILSRCRDVHSRQYVWRLQISKAVEPSRRTPHTFQYLKHIIHTTVGIIHGYRYLAPILQQSSEGPIQPSYTVVKCAFTSSHLCHCCTPKDDRITNLYTRWTTT